MPLVAPKLASLVIQFAKVEIGVEEHPRGSNRGPRVDEYQAATWLKKKDWGAWCAAFVDFIVRAAMEEGVKRGAKYTFQRPQTAGAFDLARWSREQDKSTQTKANPDRDIESGDIVIFEWSHVGFATSKPDSKGYFTTIEGNTDPKGGREGYAVFTRKRHISGVQTRIRFTS
ncbi:MAG: CHAP domain-containing protein [Verrucomicrobiota bacterium]